MKLESKTNVNQLVSHTPSAIARRVAAARLHPLGAINRAPTTKSFHYRNKGNLATVGRSYAIVDMGPIRFTGFIAWAMWLSIHILYLIGFRNRFLVMFQWAWAYLTFQRGARLITFENHTHLLE